MPIPESQLERWSHQGATESSAAAYQAVRNAIERSAKLQTHSVEVYLQGSYRNSTNIRGESDVDIVVQSRATFFYNVEQLSGADRQTVEALPAATYGWDEFRADVLAALISYFGAPRVVDRNKCITVLNAGGIGISADVVPAFTHRRYIRSLTYVEGIAFRTQRDHRLIVNYPKQHYDNGVDKQDRTGSEFKATVRIYKNARSDLVDKGAMTEALAPSYFIECLMFNVPDSVFIART